MRHDTVGSRAFYIVQPYGAPGNYNEATVVATSDSLQSAWRRLDVMHTQMANLGVDVDYVKLAVVDDARRLMARPKAMLQ